MDPAPQDRATSAASRWLYALPDWFVADAATQRDPDALRRARLLVLCGFLFALPALLFFQQTLTAGTFPPLIPAAFLTAAALFVGAPLLLRARRPVPVAGVFLTSACLLLDVFIATTSGGFEVSALVWVTTTPLLAAFFVGTTASFAFAGVSCAAMVALFALDRAGFPFPSMAPADGGGDWFALLSLLNVTALVAVAGWLYEKQTSRGLGGLYRALQQAHASLAERESLYRSLTEQASEAIFVSVADGCFVEANERACALTGYSRDELLAMGPAQLLAPDALRQAPSDPDVLARGTVYEQVLARRDGSTFPVEVSLRLVDGGLLQAIVRDVTERKRYEAALVAAKEQAEEMSRLKTAFLANMSHEIRTPLTSILGFGEILAEAASDEDRQFATLILRNGHRLMDTLNSVLDLAQIESRTLSLRLQPVDACERARDAVQLLEPLARARSLYLRTETGAGPALATLDPAAFDRILTNLVSNALKFTEEGGVVVRAFACGDEVVVQVADTGIGIAPDFVPHLFDEFTQESQGLRRSHEGVGLGLTITHRLVTLMDGRIEVESTPGRGTTFTVRFPAADGVEAPEAAVGDDVRAPSPT